MVIKRRHFVNTNYSVSAGLTMWQMWQMPRASGLRGAEMRGYRFFNIRILSVSVKTIRIRILSVSVVLQWYNMTP